MRPDRLVNYAGRLRRLTKDSWRRRAVLICKSMAERGIGAKDQSNSLVAGSPRNVLQDSARAERGAVEQRPATDELRTRSVT